MTRSVLIALGFISLTLGIIGSFVPLLPTTPFLLLAAYFFSKSSEKWYRWLISLPKFGKSIQDYNENGVISKKSKLACAISILGVITWIGFFTQYKLIVRIIIPTVLIIVLTYVLTRPSTKGREER